MTQAEVQWLQQWFNTLYQRQGKLMASIDTLTAAVQKLLADDAAKTSQLAQASSDLAAANAALAAVKAQAAQTDSQMDALSASITAALAPQPQPVQLQAMAPKAMPNIMPALQTFLAWAESPEGQAALAMLGNLLRNVIPVA